jgi:hypothetical protein
MIEFDWNPHAWRKGNTSKRFVALEFELECDFLLTTEPYLRLDSKQWGELT